MLLLVHFKIFEYFIKKKYLNKLKQMQGISGEMVIMTDCGSVVPGLIHGLSIFALFHILNCQLDAGSMGVKEIKLAPGVYNVKPIIGWGVQSTGYWKR